MLREQIVAFYDETARVVHVRDTATHAEDEEGETAWVVAHEIGHALQHQYFSLPDPKLLADDDSALAALSMLEGDAMLTMLAFAANVNHMPLKRVLVNAQRAVDRGEVEEYERVRGRSPALMAAPAIVRERMTFPYLGGMYFMGQLFRAGGFALVNRVYEVPPVTTEQVMHVDKYLAGEGAIQVESPRAPAGYRALGSGRMGELQLRVTLAQCVGKAAAYTAAAGWGGDAYTVVASARGAPALLFTSAWDSEDEAREFEASVGAAARCWDAATASGFPGPTLVERSGANVAFTRGLAPPLAARDTLRLIALRLWFPRRARRSGRFRSRRCALRPRCPPTCSCRMPSSASAWGSSPRCRRGIPRGSIGSRAEPECAGRRRMAAIGLSEMSTTPEANELLFSSFIDGMRNETPDVASVPARRARSARRSARRSRARGASPTARRCA